jgi:[glutamine synthetase] adenylyltransferase / [glutamine synthetase]-adenylyl-L-tyrosine phosphorylase
MSTGLPEELNGNSAAERLSEVLGRCDWFDSHRAAESLSLLARVLEPSVLQPLLDVLSGVGDPPRALDTLALLADEQGAEWLSHAEPSLLVPLLSDSPFLSGLLARTPELLEWYQKEIADPWDRDQLVNDLAGILGCEFCAIEDFNPVHAWHRRHLLRIGWADIADLRGIDVIAAELSALADVTVQIVGESWGHHMVSRYGQPLHDDGTTAQWSIIALGKLGGNELNFHSDIDVLFVYSAEGTSDDSGTREGIVLNMWYSRWAEGVINTLTEVSSGGTFYRVDTRLRPDGRAGGLVRGLSSYERYYETRGEVWERQMLIKARPIAGDMELGETFVERLRPFVFPRSLARSPREEIRHVKTRILNHLAARSLSEGSMPSERNLKLRRGGLRDIEFIAQCLQLVVGGADVAIRSPNTLTAVEEMRERRVLQSEEADSLRKAYVAYRRIEHSLQMHDGQSTFDLPDSPAIRSIVARRMGEQGNRGLLSFLDSIRERVTAIYEDVLGPPDALDDVTVLLDMEPGADRAQKYLRLFNIDDPVAAQTNLVSLAYGRESKDAPAGPREPMLRLITPLLEAVKKSVSPDRALASVERILSAFGAVDSFADLLASHAGFLDLLVAICGGSRSFSETLLREPELLDWVVAGGVLGGSHDSAEMELVLRASIAGLVDEGRITKALHTFRKRETMRVGVEHLLGIVDAEGASDRLTAIADAVVRLVHRRATHSVFDQRGTPLDSADNPTGLAIVAVGKLGSGEMNFGSDLDVFFVYGADGVTTKDRDNVSVFTFVGQRIMRDLRDPTRYGTLYEVDARLRPEGNSAPLVISLNGYRKYLADRASTWERLALTRSYVLAPREEDDHELCSSLSETISDFAYGPVSVSEVDTIIEMRTRMEMESARKYGDARNVKTGPGGIVDAEFVAQTGQIVFGGLNPDLRGKRTLQVLRALGEAGHLSRETASVLTESCAYLLRLQVALRIDDEHAHNVLPDEEVEQAILARRMGLDSASALQSQLSEVMSRTREAYQDAMKTLREAI